MEKNNTGRFVKGVIPKGATPICEGNAKAYQQRSVKSRRERTLLRDAIIKELSKRVKAGESTNKIEAIVVKAIDGHLEGNITFRDLTYLQELLGEKKLNINHNSAEPLVISDSEAAALDKWTKK